MPALSTQRCSNNVLLLLGFYARSSSNNVLLLLILIGARTISLFTTRKSESSNNMLLLLPFVISFTMRKSGSSINKLVLLLCVISFTAHVLANQGAGTICCYTFQGEATIVGCCCWCCSYQLHRQTNQGSSNNVLFDGGCVQIKQQLQ
jgi:hypothetical protein